MNEKRNLSLNITDFEITKKELLFQIPKYPFEVWKEQHLFFQNETHDIITVKLNDWVQIIPVHQGKLVMVKQYRGPWRALSLEFPAGKIETGEESLVAAKRELAEEAGYQAEHWTLLGTSKPITWTTQTQYLYLAENLSPYKLPEDPAEYFSVHAFTPQQIHTMITNGEILETPSIASFYRYLSYKCQSQLDACFHD